MHSFLLTGRSGWTIRERRPRFRLTGQGNNPTNLPRGKRWSKRNDFFPTRMRGHGSSHTWTVSESDTGRCHLYITTGAVFAPLRILPVMAHWLRLFRHRLIALFFGSHQEMSRLIVGSTGS